jgi:hypothetical protein
MLKCREIMIDIGLDPMLEKQGEKRTTYEKGALSFSFSLLFFMCE